MAITWDWFGIEISDTLLGRDGKLTTLDKDSFLKELNKITVMLKLR